MVSGKSVWKGVEIAPESVKLLVGPCFCSPRVGVFFISETRSSFFKVHMQGYLSNT